ncbi:hypothetical protein EDC01DRAFT_634104 [Geopyxis carbonaria]|nr:hypothetical protein EDC01DRAFT_634104 [Geopyxis carbonaria]
MADNPDNPECDECKDCTVPCVDGTRDRPPPAPSINQTQPSYLLPEDILELRTRDDEKNACRLIEMYENEPDFAACFYEYFAEARVMYHTYLCRTPAARNVPLDLRQPINADDHPMYAWMCGELPKLKRKLAQLMELHQEMSRYATLLKTDVKATHNRSKLRAFKGKLENWEKEKRHPTSKEMAILASKQFLLALAEYGNLYTMYEKSRKRLEEKLDGLEARKGKKYPEYRKLLDDNKPVVFGDSAEVEDRIGELLTNYWMFPSREYALQTDRWPRVTAGYSVSKFLELHGACDPRPEPVVPADSVPAPSK